MKKKGLWLLILVVFGFIIYDYVSSSQKEQAALEEAQKASDLLVEETAPETEVNELVEGYLQNKNNPTDPALQFGATPGFTAYDFSLEDMNGNIVNLSDFRGKKVFLNFWASWCPPCRVEMPHLQAFSEENENVVVLGVNVTSSESNLENVAEFVDEFSLTFPNLYGTEEVFGLYSVRSLPTSYFIDSNGIVNEAVIGPVTKDILEARFSMMN